MNGCDCGAAAGWKSSDRMKAAQLVESSLAVWDRREKTSDRVQKYRRGHEKEPSRPLIQFLISSFEFSWFKIC